MGATQTEHKNTDGDCGLSPVAQAAIATSQGQLRSKSASAARAKATTPPAAPTVSDLNISLSILRANFAEAKNGGLPVRSGVVNGKLIVEIRGVIVCPVCTGWWIGNCPTCNESSSTETGAA
jgi:hypothetical protein